MPGIFFILRKLKGVSAVYTINIPGHICRHMLPTHLDTEILSLYTLDTCRRHILWHTWAICCQKWAEKQDFGREMEDSERGRCVLGAAATILEIAAEERRKKRRNVQQNGYGQSPGSPWESNMGLTPLSWRSSGWEIGILVYEFPAYEPSSIF